MKFFITLLTSIISIQNYNISYASFYCVEDDFYDKRPILSRALKTDIDSIRNIRELDDLQIKYHEKLSNIAEELKKLNEMPVIDRTDEQYKSKCSKLRARLFSTVQIIELLLTRRKTLERRQDRVSSKVIDELNKKNN